MDDMVNGKTVDGRGRCCGRKPIPYKRPPHLFCPRCNASFDPETGRQIDNWAYRSAGGDMFLDVYGKRMRS